MAGDKYRKQLFFIIYSAGPLSNPVVPRQAEASSTVGYAEASERGRGETKNYVSSQSYHLLFQLTLFRCVLLLSVYKTRITWMLDNTDYL